MHVISNHFTNKYLVFPNVFESSGDLFPAIVVPISKALNLGELYSGETRTKSNVVPRTRDSMLTSLIRPVNSRNVASILKKRKKWYVVNDINYTNYTLYSIIIFKSKIIWFLGKRFKLISSHELREYI